MKDTDLAYYAGILDGEGTIRIGKNKPLEYHTRTAHYYLQVIIANQNLQVLEELKQCFGGSIQRATGCYHLHMASRMAASFLEAVKPYSRIKLPQIEVALQFQVLQTANAGNRQKKSDAYMLDLDGFRQRLSDLKQIDKLEFKIEFVNTRIETIDSEMETK